MEQDIRGMVYSSISVVTGAGQDVLRDEMKIALLGIKGPKVSHLEGLLGAAMSQNVLLRDSDNIGDVIRRLETQRVPA